MDSSRLNPMNLHPRALPKDEAAVPLASPGRVRPTAIRSRRSSTKDSPAVTTGANSIIHGIQYDFGNEFAEYSEVKEEQEPAETTEQQVRCVVIVTCCNNDYNGSIVVCAMEMLCCQRKTLERT